MPKQDPELENLAEVIKTRGKPRDLPGDENGRHFDIRIARDGTWYYRDTPIRRLALCKLFASVLTRRGDGSYWLVTPVERGRIDVEDAPFTAVEMTASGEGREQVLRFRTNLDDEVEADADHPIRVQVEAVSGTPRPYVRVRGDLDALILRSVFYDMVDHAVEQNAVDGETLGVWSRGVFFPIGPLGM